MVEERTKRILKFLLRVLITSLLLVVVFSSVELRQLGGAVKNARWLYLVIVWILVAAAFWIRALKLKIALRKQQCEVEVGTVFGASMITTLYGLIMPGILSTTVKWYILKRDTGKGSNVFSSMVYNQVTEIAVRVLVGILAIMVTNPTGDSRVFIVCAIFAALIIIGIILLLNKWTGEKFSIFAGYILRPFPEVIRTTVGRILEQIKVFQSAGLGFHLLIIAITLVDALFGAVIYVCAARAAAIEVSPMVLVWQSSVVYLLGRLPISIANLGVREFTLIEFLSLYGVDASAALLMSFTIFSAAIVMAAIGAGYQIAWMFGGKQMESVDN